MYYCHLFADTAETNLQLNNWNEQDGKVARHWQPPEKLEKKPTIKNVGNCENYENAKLEVYKM